MVAQAHNKQQKTGTVQVNIPGFSPVTLYCDEQPPVGDDQAPPPLAFFTAGIGFCHNDLLASNIMMLTKSQDPCESDEKQPLLLEGLRFVDFEYGGINYYAYDIANHFNEYAGGTAAEDNSTPDYGRCPSDQEQKAFLQAYADEYNTSKASRVNGSNVNTITAEELGAMVDGFSLANHLVWGLWGILQAATEGGEDGLDYLHYAKCRFDRYTHDKRKKYGMSN